MFNYSTTLDAKNVKVLFIILLFYTIVSLIVFKWIEYLEKWQEVFISFIGYVLFYIFFIYMINLNDKTIETLIILSSLFIHSFNGMFLSFQDKFFIKENSFMSVILSVIFLFVLFKFSNKETIYFILILQSILFFMAINGLYKLINKVLFFDNYNIYMWIIYISISAVIMLSFLIKPNSSEIWNILFIFLTIVGFIFGKFIKHKFN